MLIKLHFLIRPSPLPGLFLACLIAAANSHGVFAAQAVIDYVAAPEQASGFIIDTRRAEQCEKASLSGVRCLSARDILGPHKKLANFSGLLWLLGTAGLTGDEHVLVVGDQSRDKEFLAGVLYLAGQRKVSVLTPPLKTRPEGKLVPGISRSKTRENVYQAAMRETGIVLRSELADMLRSGNAPVILDGRGESEYWGQEIRASRGGHLPGAQHLPALSLGPGKDGPPPIHLSEGEYAIAYAHDSYESIVFLTRLAAVGIKAKVLLEGWAGWASDGSLPVDGVTYAGQAVSRPAAVMSTQLASKIGMPLIALAILAGIALIAAGFIAGRRFSR